MLRVNLKLWDEVLFAHGTSDSVGREILAEAGYDLFLLERFLALLTEVFKL